jgi:predicted aspartyl protease
MYASTVLIGALLMQGAAPVSPGGSAPPPQLSAPAPGSSAMVYVRFEGAKTAKPAPFELVKGTVVLKMQVAGKDVWALLDSGAGRSIIDEGFAREAGLTSAPSGIVLVTPTGKMAARQILQAPVAVPGNFDVVLPRVASADLGAMSRWTGRKIDFVFGADLMKGMVVAINMPAKAMRLAPSGTIKGKPDAFVLPLSGEATALAALSVDGKPLTLQIDLGSNAQLVLTPQAWDRLGEAGKQVGTSTSTHADGAVVETVVGMLPRVSAGDREIQDVEVRVRPWPTADGAVGMGLLSRYWTVILDLQQRKLWLIDRPAPAGPAPATPAAEPKS